MAVTNGAHGGGAEEHDNKPAYAPRDLKAEESVIGGVLAQVIELASVKPLIASLDDFYDPALRAIYEAMLSVDADGDAVDVIGVRDRMRSTDTVRMLEQRGGERWLSELMDKAPHEAERITDDARQIGELAIQRGTLERATEILQAGYFHGAQPSETFEALEALGRRAAEARQGCGELPPTIAEILRDAAKAPPQRTYPTGITQLDDLICGGFKSRQVGFIVASTGAGKTGLMGTLALKWAHDGTPVLWVATEIDEEEQAARLTAIDLRVQKIMTASVDDLMSGRVLYSKALPHVESLPIRIIVLDDPEDADPFAKIRAHVVGMRKATGIAPIVIVDYLQVFAITAEPRTRLIKLAADCRRLARDLDVAIIGISSTSRANAGANRNRKPAGEEENPLDDLNSAAESSAIEYAAAVLGVLKTEEKCTELGEYQARLSIAKSRRGHRGYVGLVFHGPSGAFTAKPEAVQAMSAANQDARDDVTVRKIVEAPGYKPVSATELRNSIVGMAVDRRKRTIDRLIAVGTLRKTQIKERDECNRLRNKGVVVPANWQPPQMGLLDDKGG